MPYYDYRCGQGAQPPKVVTVGQPKKRRSPPQLEAGFSIGHVPVRERQYVNLSHAVCRSTWTGI